MHNKIFCKKQQVIHYINTSHNLITGLPISQIYLPRSGSYQLKIVHIIHFYLFIY